MSDERDIRSLHSKFDSFQNRINEQHAKTQRDLGALTAGIDSLGNYIKAVSINTKDNREELDEHKEDMDAHGLGASRKSVSAIIPWMALVVSVGGFVLLIFRLAKAG